MPGDQQLIEVFHWLADWYVRDGARGCGFVNAAVELPDPEDPGRLAAQAEKRLPLMVARAIIEITVLVAGGLLGGQIGIGTALFAFTIGPLVAWCLPKLRVRPAATQVESPPVDPIRPGGR